MAPNQQRKADSDGEQAAPQQPVAAGPSAADRRLWIAQLCGLAVGVGIAIWYEVARLFENAENGVPAGEWYVGVNVDTTPFLWLFLLLPLFWIMRRPLFEVGAVTAWWHNWFGPQTKPAVGEGRGVLRRAIVLSLLVASVSLAMSERIGSRFANMPPAYHDEYSYVFQAETLLAGRLWFPSSAAAPELFDQMHVLNDNGRFVSRYFPGAGAWIAPFLALGNPYWGHWLAGAISACFVFWAGRELGGNLAGFTAGLLTALSPGLGLFSNLLLAHHPALVGLTLFLFAFLRMMRTHGWGSALVAGAGLAFAMLCRPMTAAGFALPFGIWFVCWWLGLMPGKSAGSWGKRTRVVLAMGAPLLAGLILLFFYNQAITGSGWTTPYQLYTDIYTPRHVYGFNNVVRGEQHLGPKVLENYDRWAENLTPAMAARNVVVRFVTSLSWSLGIIPLAMAFVVFLMAVAPRDGRWWLIGASILTLHAAHVPYWYVGIMHWHYVFETAVPWLLIFGGATAALCHGWQAIERPLMPVWWGAVVLAAMLPTFVPLQPLWGRSRLNDGVDSIVYSRKKYLSLAVIVRKYVQERPALVLIEHDTSQQHIDYVANSPGLERDVIYGRKRPQGRSLVEIARLFPERAVYVYQPSQRRLRLISKPAP